MKSLILVGNLRVSLETSMKLILLRKQCKIPIFFRKTLVKYYFGGKLISKYCLTGGPSVRSLFLPTMPPLPFQVSPSHYGGGGQMLPTPPPPYHQPIYPPMQYR